MADVPAHYHAIAKVTARWADYVKAVKDLATNTPAERAREQDKETDREVHVTGHPHSQKGG